MSGFSIFNVIGSKPHYQSLDQSNQDSQKIYFLNEFQENYFSMNLLQSFFLKQHQVQSVEEDKNYLKINNCYLNQQKSEIFQQSELIMMRKSHRIVRPIQCDQSVIQRRNKCLKGTLTETQNIGKHIKSVTVAFLQMLNDAKMLDDQEQRALASFRKKNGGIPDFVQLFRHQNIRRICERFYSSTDFVQIILNSPKMQIKNKLAMIKYLRSFSKIAYCKIAKWKLKHP